MRTFRLLATVGFCFSIIGLAIAQEQGISQSWLRISMGRVFPVSALSIPIELTDTSLKDGVIDFGSTELGYELEWFGEKGYTGDSIQSMDSFSGNTHTVKWVPNPDSGLTEIIVEKIESVPEIKGDWSFDLYDLYPSRADDSGFDPGYYRLNVKREEQLLVSHDFTIYVNGSEAIEFFIGILENSNSVFRKDWARNYLQKLTGKPEWRLSEGELAGNEAAQKAAIDEYKRWWEHNKENYKPIESPLVISDAEFSQLKEADLQPKREIGSDTI